jgi:hypothetical protein
LPKLKEGFRKAFLLLIKLLTEPITIMWFTVVYMRQWAKRNDAEWVDHLMAVEIVLLNLLKMDSLCNTRLLVQILCVVKEVGEVTNSLEIALEMRHIYRIKPYKGCKEPPVCERNVVPHKIPLVFQACLHLLKCVKQLGYCSVIGFLRLGKPTLVYTIVYLVVDDFIN